MGERPPLNLTGDARTRKARNIMAFASGKGPERASSLWVKGCGEGFFQRIHDDLITFIERKPLR